MTAIQIKRARRELARARIGVCGPSGSGKTMSALRLARGMAEALVEANVLKQIEGAIGCIDTERKSMSLYADVVPFDVIEMEPPYSPERYREAIEALERYGCAILILDQISHAWAGPGGLLEYVDTLKAQSRNSMSPWAKATPEQNRFVDRMLRSDAHIIATMRSKAEWVIEEQLVDGRKKQVPRKIGLSPVQREGIEYEFTAMLDLDVDGNTATASKDRTRLFVGQTFKIDEEWGRKLARWLGSAEATQPTPASANEPAKTAPATGAGASARTRTPRARTRGKSRARAAKGDPPENGSKPEPRIGKDGQRELWDSVKQRAAAIQMDAAELLRQVLEEHHFAGSDQVTLRALPDLLHTVETYSVV